MTYRDETEALRARIEVLENELADAHARIADLTGERRPAPPDEANSLWLAAPSKLLLERELDGEPTPEILDRLSTLFRREYPLGTLTPSERAFGFRQGTLDVSLTPIGGGRSRLRLFVDHRALAMLPPMLAMSMVLLAMAPIGATLGPVAVLVMLPIGFTLAFLLLRKLWGVRGR